MRLKELKYLMEGEKSLKKKERIEFECVLKLIARIKIKFRLICIVEIV